jgi:pimeloyl-ACP methyl ester carboxylesterase
MKELNWWQRLIHKRAITPIDSYVEMDGHTFFMREWPGIKPSGAPILLLHGGLSSTQGWDYAMVPGLIHNHHIYAFDRSAHGRTGAREGYFHFDFQTAECIAFIEKFIKQPVKLVGWSDGAIISLMIGIQRPELVESIVSIGANYNWDCGLTLTDAVIEISEESRAKWRAMSPDPDHMQEEIIRTAMEVWRTEPTMTTDDLAKINAPTLVLTGDDEPFSQHHTIYLYQSLPNGKLAIIPGASHAVMKERPEMVSLMINDFYAHPEYPITRMPNLRKVKTDELLGNTMESAG